MTQKAWLLMYDHKDNTWAVTISRGAYTCLFGSYLPIYVIYDNMYLVYGLIYYYVWLHANPHLDCERNYSLTWGMCAMCPHIQSNPHYWSLYPPCQVCSSRPFYITGMLHCVSPQCHPTLPSALSHDDASMQMSYVPVLPVWVILLSLRQHAASVSSVTACFPQQLCCHPQLACRL